MANKKISQLTVAAPLTGTEVLPIVQGGETKKIAVQDLRPYKVFTALLTQSGGNNLNDSSNSESKKSLAIGTTYLIQYNVDLEADFTNVGAPNNNEGTYFIATGEVPANWGSSSGLVFNVGAPRATVLENTIGNVWFIYQGVGEYSLDSIELFTSDKTYLYIQSVPYPDGETEIGINRASDNTVAISNTQGGTYSDNVLNFGASIEIRVYN
jgi:hypothetical protein